MTVEKIIIVQECCLTDNGITRILLIWDSKVTKTMHELLKMFFNDFGKSSSVSRIPRIPAYASSVVEAPHTKVWLILAVTTFTVALYICCEQTGAVSNGYSIRWTTTTQSFTGGVGREGGPTNYVYKPNPKQVAPICSNCVLVLPILLSLLPAYPT